MDVSSVQFIINGDDNNGGDVAATTSFKNLVPLAFFFSIII